MKIMFICTGNICRSAMAHWLMEKKIKDRDIKGIEVYSCGVFANDGDGATFTAEEAMEEYAVDLKKHRATNIVNSKVEEMDIVLCATMSHKNTVLYRYPELKDKVYTMKEYAEFNQDDLDIKDPWGYDIEIYRFCAAEIDRCLDKTIEKLK